MNIQTIGVESFAIPLLEPFAISRASVDSTRAVLVRVRVGGFEGLGEAALPLGSVETVDDLARSVERAGTALLGRSMSTMVAVDELVDACFEGPPAARSGLHCALVDALARGLGLPLHRLLGAHEAPPITTDITLPICEPSHQAVLARGYLERGFEVLKVKVGADLDADRRTCDALADATPTAALRFDANEGFDAASALALVEHARRRGLFVECFEQPCARADLDGLREVRRAEVPVVADESLSSLDDLWRLVDADAVDGVNLKLVKLGGVDRCLAIGRSARQCGLDLMVGAMIESRLGLTAMAHVVAALGGARWVDLDTAFLLARDPVRGGLRSDGARLTLPDGPGLAAHVDVERASSP